MIDDQILEGDVGELEMLSIIGFDGKSIIIFNYLRVINLMSKFAFLFRNDIKRLPCASGRGTRPLPVG